MQHIKDILQQLLPLDIEEDDIDPIILTDKDDFITTPVYHYEIIRTLTILKGEH